MMDGNSSLEPNTQEVEEILASLCSDSMSQKSRSSAEPSSQEVRSADSKSPEAVHPTKRRRLQSSPIELRYDEHKSVIDSDPQLSSWIHSRSSQKSCQDRQGQVIDAMNLLSQSQNAEKVEQGLLDSDNDEEDRDDRYFHDYCS